MFLDKDPFLGISGVLGIIANKYLEAQFILKYWQFTVYLGVAISIL